MNYSSATLVIVLLLILVFPCQTKGNHVFDETLEGDWVGGTNAPGQWMSVQVRFTRKDTTFEGVLDGFFEAQLGFDYLAIRNLPLRNIKAERQVIQFEIPSPQGIFTFTGALKDGVITASSNGGKALLHLVRSAPLSPQQLSQYVGSYKNETKKFGITWREFGGLRLIELRSGFSQSLIPISADTFCTQKSILTGPTTAELITFVKDKEGNVIAFEQRMAGAPKVVALKTATFRQEQVSFKNGETSFFGTLLLPSGRGPHPAVVLVHGYGPIYRTALFERAATFTRMGVAALIYDKRGTGLSSGKWQMSATSFDDLADDALAAIQILKARKDIIHHQIGLQGHSQAGNIIPIAAAKSEDVAFAIVASGGGVKMEEGIIYEKRNDLISAGRFSEQQIDDATQLLRRVHDYVIRGIGDRSQLEADYLKAQKEPWFSTTDLPRFKSLPANDSPEMFYARKEISADSAVYIERLKIPVLVLLGEEDKVNPTQQAAQGWRASLKKAGNRKFQIEIIPGADHGLRVQDVEGKRKVSSEYWGVMSTWLFIQLDGVKQS